MEKAGLSFVIGDSVKCKIKAVIQKLQLMFHYTLFLANSKF